jgi:T-complex protein 11
MEHDQSIAEVPLPDLSLHDDIPEENEDMTVSDQEGHAFAPPARIAARFFRHATTRRKSSAASSRRNSLSSAHSLQSNSSYSNARRNNHVAQYLRRASIIQSRKDRLAAREAHAEQVRLRAALAKAAPRSSNSEERALAAEQARKKHLASVAAACAEEVRKAKKVAEEMKERRAAEEERVRLEMTEKHAEAERRRLEYKRNMRRPRTSSSPSSGQPKQPIAKPRPSMDKETAAKCIQSAWRVSRRKRALDKFSELGLSIEKVHDTTFEEIRELLNEDKVLNITTDVLNLFDLQPNDENQFSGGMATRTFLSAYMILGHPEEVLSQDGDLEQALMTKAKELVISFEAIVSKCTAFNKYSPPATLLEGLRLAHSTYFTAFSDWKARDSSLLIELMVASFVNLESIWQNVKDDNDGGVADDYKDGIRKNQVALLARIQKLAGRDRGYKLVQSALRENKRRRRRKPVGDLIRPRAAPDIHEAPSDGSEDVSVTTDTASHLAQQPIPKPEAEMNALNRVFSVFPPNRVLTHELALDKDYRVDISPHSQLHDAVNREICDAMRQAFDNGEGAKWTIAMAENIRHKLLHLVKTPKHPLQPVISETLDPELIAREVSQGVFSYYKFFNFMATLLPKLCAPVRDEEVKALAEELRREGDTGEMIEKLFKLLHVMDLLCLDFSNFILSSVAPTLMKESVGYEHRMFAQDLQTGVHTLEKTKRWWNNASVNMVTESDRQTPGDRPSVQKIYARGLVDLAIAPTALRDMDVPETLQLDFDRFKKLRSRSVRIALIGAILITAKNLMKRDVRHQWRPEANRMWETLKGGYGKEDESIPNKILSIVESAHPMPPSSKAHLQGTITRLLAQAESGRLTDAVVKVLFQRLKTHIFNRLSATSSGERVRVATTASEGLASSGLPEFVQHIGDIVDILAKVSDVDRKAHALWYQQIAAEVEAMGNEER